MKHLLLTTIAAVLLVGCGESQQSAPKSKPPTVTAPGITLHLEGLPRLAQRVVFPNTEFFNENQTIIF